MQTPVGEFKPTIRGSFDSLDEDVRPKISTNNHEFKVIMRPNPADFIPEMFPSCGEYNLRTATRLGNHQLRDSIVGEPITVS